MNKDFELEWVVFAALITAFTGLELYAIKTKKIRPFTHMMRRSWRYGNRETDNELIKFVVAGAWTGFSAWQFKHFFLEGHSE